MKGRSSVTCDKQISTVLTKIEALSLRMNIFVARMKIYSMQIYSM